MTSLPNKIKLDAQSAIGIFDSGLGGLTVLSAIHKLLPHEDLIYFGDTARVPYGSKSKETVIRYSIEIADFLQTKNIKMIVVACNTASSHALSALQKKFSIPVLGVVEPGVAALQSLHHEQLQKVAVIATRSTVRSQAYQQEIEKQFANIQLVAQACPLFVPLVEEGLLDKNFTDMIVRQYLDELDREQIKHIILGCTHYPLLKKTIQRLYPHFHLIDSSVQTAKTVQNILTEKNLLHANGGSIRLYVSDITDSLQDMATLFFGESIASVEKIALNW